MFPQQFLHYLLQVWIYFVLASPSVFELSISILKNELPLRFPQLSYLPKYNIYGNLFFTYTSGQIYDLKDQVINRIDIVTAFNKSTN